MIVITIKTLPRKYTKLSRTKSAICQILYGKTVFSKKYGSKWYGCRTKYEWAFWPEIRYIVMYTLNLHPGVKLSNIAYLCQINIMLFQQKFPNTYQLRTTKNLNNNFLNNSNFKRHFGFLPKNIKFEVGKFQ